MATSRGARPGGLIPGRGVSNVTVQKCGRPVVSTAATLPAPCGWGFLRSDSAWGAQCEGRGQSLCCVLPSLHPSSRLCGRTGPWPRGGNSSYSREPAWRVDKPGFGARPEETPGSPAGPFGPCFPSPAWESDRWGLALSTLPPAGPKAELPATGPTPVPPPSIRKRAASCHVLSVPPRGQDLWGSSGSPPPCLAPQIQHAPS